MAKDFEVDVEQVFKDVAVEPVAKQILMFFCPRCHAKLGEFNWFDKQCECGQKIKGANGRGN